MVVLERTKALPGLQLCLLAIVAAGATYARSEVGPLQESVRISLSLTDNQMALLQGPALALPLFLLSMPLGVLIDRRSRVSLLFSFVFLSIVGNLLTATTSSFVLLFVVRGLIGLSSPATSIAVLSLIADHYEPSKRGRALMTISLGQVFGDSAAFAAGGLLLSTLGSGANGWRGVMVCLSIPLFLVLSLFLLLREPPRRETVIRNPSARVGAAELWRYRTVILPLLIGGLMVGMVDVAVQIWAAPMYARRFNLPADRIGTLMAIVLLISGVIGPILGGFLADVCQRHGGGRGMVAALSGLALLSVPAGLLGVAPGIVFTGVLLAAFVTIGNAIGVMQATLFTIVIPNELRGVCIGLSTTVGIPFSMGISPLVASFLSDTLGGPAALGKGLTIMCMSVSLLGAVSFAWGQRYFSHSSQARIESSQ